MFSSDSTGAYRHPISHAFPCNSALRFTTHHTVPLEFTPSLTHLCLPFFDLRTDEGPLQLTPNNVNAPTPSPFAPLDPLLSSPAIPHLQMLVLTLNPRYWRFDERSLKGWALGAMARDARLYVIAETREDATRDWECARRDWEDEARVTHMREKRYGGAQRGVREWEAEEMGGVWAKAVEVRRKFLTRASKTFD